MALSTAPTATSVSTRQPNGILGVDACVGWWMGGYAAQLGYSPHVVTGVESSAPARSRVVRSWSSLATPIRPWQAVKQSGKFLVAPESGGYENYCFQEDSGTKWVTAPDNEATWMAATYPGGLIGSSEPFAVWMVCKWSLAGSLTYAPLLDVYARAVGNGASVYVYVDVATEALMVAADQGAATGPRVTSDAWHLVYVEVVPTTGVVTVAVDGGAEVSLTGTPSVWPGDINRLDIGYSVVGVDAYRFAGSIGELVVANQVPTSTQKANMETYFQKRWTELTLS